MSVGFDLNIEGIDAVQDYLRRASQIEMKDLFLDITDEVESQTRRRMEEERETPDGVPWKPWSKAYAKTRHGNHSLLQSEGHLIDSIQSEVSSDRAAVGSNWKYARIHQKGSGKVGRGIPAREYLGLSEGNLREIDDVIGRFMARHLAK